MFAGKLAVCFWGTQVTSDTLEWWYLCNGIHSPVKAGVWGIPLLRQQLDEVLVHSCILLQTLIEILKAFGIVADQFRESSLVYCLRSGDRRFLCFFPLILLYLIYRRFPLHLRIFKLRFKFRMFGIIIKTSHTFLGRILTWSRRGKCMFIQRGVLDMYIRIILFVGRIVLRDGRV